MRDRIISGPSKEEIGASLLSRSEPLLVGFVVEWSKPENHRQGTQSLEVEITSLTRHLGFYASEGEEQLFGLTVKTEEIWCFVGDDDKGGVTIEGVYSTTSCRGLLTCHIDG